MRIEIEVHARAFRAAIPAAMEEYRQLGERFAEDVGDKVVERAKVLAPVGTDPRDPPGRLRESIHRTPFVRTFDGGRLMIIAGGGAVREALPMEFGTYKDRAQPYMRPALAAAAGGVRSIGAYIRLSSTRRARELRRRVRGRSRRQQ